MKLARSHLLLTLLSAATLCLAPAVIKNVTAADSAHTIPNTIVVKGFMFTPMTIKVKTGSKVTWINKDEEPHTVAGDAGAFRSGALDTDESFSFVFEQPGTYHYTCTIHPQMIGTITVE